MTDFPDNPGEMPGEAPPQPWRAPISPLAHFNDLRVENLVWKKRADRLRELHHRRIDDAGDYCYEEGEDWPCQTIHIIDGLAHEDEMEEARRELFGEARGPVETEAAEATGNEGFPTGKSVIE